MDTGRRTPDVGAHRRASSVLRGARRPGRAALGHRGGGSRTQAARRRRPRHHRSRPQAGAIAGRRRRSARPGAASGRRRTVTVTGDRRRRPARSCARWCANSRCCITPDLVGVAVRAGQDAAASWDWLKWLPHQGDHGAVRHRVVIVDGADAPGAGRGRDRRRDPRRGSRVGGRSCTSIRRGTGRGVRPAVAARRRWRALGVSRGTDPRRDRCIPVGRPADWPALMGIEDPDLIDAEALWASGRVATAGADRRRRGRHRGRTRHQGGCRRTVWVRTGCVWVRPARASRSSCARSSLGMIAAHPPEALNLVLVDFKGGATFLGLDTARHVSAVITNLADEAPLVARMREALAGEVHRRQEILRAAGNFVNIAEYHRARARTAGPSRRCRRCSSSSTSSPSCSASIPTSPSCSWRSDGWAGRWACTCCWPASASTRAGCADWKPTCPTGSA